MNVDGPELNGSHEAVRTTTLHLSTESRSSEIAGTLKGEQKEDEASHF